MEINSSIKAKWYGGKRNITGILYIVVHYTANGGLTATAKGNANYFSTTDRKASAHYIVDEKEVIYQCVPDDAIAYAVGDKGKGAMKGIITNANSISIEMVSHSDSSGYYIPEETMVRTVGLIKMLMEKYQTIRGVYRHYDVTGKICPEPLIDNKKWAAFLDRLKEEEEEMKLYKHTTDMPEWAVASVRKAISKCIIQVDKNGEISVYEPNLQVIVWMDRLGLLS